MAWRGGDPPYGWRIGSSGTLETDTTEQRRRAQIWRLRTEGASYPGICRKLMQDGLSPRSGGRWYPTQIRRIVMCQGGAE